jgi:hypothetical protein
LPISDRDLSLGHFSQAEVGQFRRARGHELRILAGHASITTTQRYMNARESSLAESMRKARERRAKHLEFRDDQDVEVG